MIIQIENFTSDNEKFLEEAHKIRNEVFVEEQNVDKFLEYDGFDDVSVHYLVFYNEKPVGTARWRETTEGIKLERFAVLKAYRGKSLASVLLKFMLEELTKLNKKIYLNSQITAQKFYEIHKFKIVGEKFIEADIIHYKMEYKK